MLLRAEGISALYGFQIRSASKLALPDAASGPGQFKRQAAPMKLSIFQYQLYSMSAHLSLGRFATGHFVPLLTGEFPIFSQPND